MESGGEASTALAPPPPPSPPPRTDVPECSACSVRRHVLGTGCVIEVLEDPSGALGGGNGATVWDCALALAQAVDGEAPRLAPREGGSGWRGARVLELGAGVGLVSMTLASLGARVVATEREIALPLLRRNVENNAVACRAAGGECEVVALDWLAAADALTNLGRFDVVIGADLVFASNAAVHAALADVLANVLAHGAECWLSHETRDVNVDTAFFAALQARGVSASRCDYSDTLPAEISIVRLSVAQVES